MSDPQGADRARQSEDETAAEADAAEAGRPAIAETGAETAAPAPEPVPERASLDEVRGWVGWRLDEIGGVGVGKIKGVYVDEQSGEAEWLLARMGRFGRYLLVPARDAVAGVDHVWVPYPRELLRGAPRIEPGRTLDVEKEAELSSHYEIGRGDELARRPPIAITSRPAE